MRRSEEFGPVYGKSSTGKIKMWKIVLNLENDKVTLNTWSGYEDGKKTSSSREIKGKKIGRANETTPWNQAVLEAVSKLNKKKDEGYVENKEDLEEQNLLLPMLAHSYDKRSKDVVWPAFIQPKLNGVRCIARMTENGPEYISRKGKKYTTLGHLDEAVEKLICKVGRPLDGEIFHPEWGFQEIIRAVKKDRGEATDELQYWIYDVVDTNTDFENRISTLSDEIVIGAGYFKPGENIKIDNVVLVPTIEVKSEQELMIEHLKFSRSFEGTIIRNKKGKYVLKNRSKDLQKYKNFQDSEYEITGGFSAEGNDSGTVVFTCKTAEGKEFSVRPMGSREKRREWLDNIESIIGKKLTVKFQEFSEDGVPIFPVGVAFRDYE